jgi:hypothetical protein
MVSLINVLYQYHVQYNMRWLGCRYPWLVERNIRAAALSYEQMEHEQISQSQKGRYQMTQIAIRQAADVATLQSILSNVIDEANEAKKRHDAQLIRVKGRVHELLGAITSLVPLIHQTLHAPADDDDELEIIRRAKLLCTPALSTSTPSPLPSSSPSLLSSNNSMQAMSALPLSQVTSARSSPTTSSPHHDKDSEIDHDNDTSDCGVGRRHDSNVAHEWHHDEEDDYPIDGVVKKSPWNQIIVPSTRPRGLII